MGIDQSITGTGVVIFDTDKDEVLHKRVITPPTDIVKYAKEKEFESSEWMNLDVYKEGLIDLGGKNLIKVKDRTKAQKKLFKLNNETRFKYIIAELAEMLKNYNVERVGMEGIAFGGSGMTSTLSELLGYIKCLTLLFGVDHKTIIITTVKKFATGKGNALKPAMMEAVEDKHKEFLFDDDILEKNEDDISDAYHIAQYISTLSDDEMRSLI